MSGKALVIHQSSDVTQLFKSVEHEFLVCEDKSSDLFDQAVIVTTIDIDEVRDATGDVHEGIFTTIASAEPLSAMDGEEEIEPTPVNRVYLMTRNQNALINQIAETLAELKATHVDGRAIEFATSEGE